MRYFIHLSYKGTSFKGWQMQKDVTTVQAVLEDAMSRLLKTSIKVTGCGRTDSGVHASQYFAHFNFEENLSDKTIFRLNKILPKSIRIHDIIEVNKSAHARYHAISRSYKYFWHTEQTAFIDEYSSLYEEKVFDFKKMAEAVKLIADQKDFKPLCKSPDKHDSTLCLIQSISLKTNKYKNQFCFEITANRFVRGMIRNIVSRLLQVGLGEIELEHLKEVLDMNHEETLPVPAHPQGLFLTEIKYKNIDCKVKTQPFVFLLHQDSDGWVTL